MSSNNQKEKQIRKNILKWYFKNKRNLPWRTSYKHNLPNPYYILISEFMLQQTTVNEVIPRFKEFIKLWPNLKKLSITQERQILKFWSGLGYYIRSKRLLKSAKIISKKYNNQIPSTFADLITLPGVGVYTAKAIMGIAYNKPVLPLDANIERIITRVYCLSESMNKIKKEIFNFSIGLISKKKSSNLIQGFMDYGSLICTPIKPHCNKCIISNKCNAFQNNLTNLIPVKNKNIKMKPKKFTRAYIILNQYNEVLLRRRPSHGMLQSMLEVPNDEWLDKKKLLKTDKIIKSLSIKHLKLIKKFIYIFNHYNLNVDIFYTLVSKKKIKNYSWLSLKKTMQSGLPTLMKKIIKIYMKSIEL